MTDTVQRFVAGLKTKLRRLHWRDMVDISTYDYGGETGSGIDGVEVNWPELEKEIDAFCAEFAAGKSAKD